MAKPFDWRKEYERRFGALPTAAPVSPPREDPPMAEIRATASPATAEEVRHDVAEEPIDATWNGAAAAPVATSPAVVSNRNQRGRDSGTWWGDATTSERVEAMRPFVEKGWSASEIARELNAPSRNAVIGMLDRHFQDRVRPGRNTGPREAMRRRMTPKLKPVPIQPQPSRSLVPLELRLPPVPMLSLDDVLQPTRTYLDEGFFCRFIPGDPKSVPIGELMVCGRERVDGSSYCAAHDRLCHNETAAVRADRARRRQEQPPLKRSTFSLRAGAYA